MKRCLLPVFVSIALIGLTGCGAEEKLIPDLLEPAGVQIDTAKVQREEIYSLQTYNGEVVPYVEELQFQKDGILEEIYVTVGDVVEEGQVLATLSDEDIFDQIQKIDQEIERIVALGEFQDIQTNYDMEILQIELDKMIREGASDQVYALKEVELKKLQAKLRQTRELRQLELQELKEKRNYLSGKMNHNQLKAPCDGRIIYVSQGKTGDLQEGDQTFICMADESRMRLCADYVTEALPANVDEYYALIGEKKCAVTYIPYEKSEYMEMLLSGNEMKVYYSLDTEEEVSIGQFAVVVYRTGYKENALTIPVNALYSDANGFYVYKISDDQRIRCDVELGIKNDIKVEILKGLKEGDVIYVME